MHISQEEYKILLELERRLKYSKLTDFYFQEEGDNDLSDPTSSWSRILYDKHMEFFRVGATHKFRYFSAANRVGKTIAGLYELSCHVTGIYPDWWEGKKFEGPNAWLIIGQTVQSTRSVLQEGLLGSDPQDPGTGMLPKKYIDFDSMKTASKASTTIDEIRVKHISGGTSTIKLRSCEMNALALAGISANVWFDEPPTQKIWDEAVVRSMVGDQIVMVTATPVKGMDPVLTNFLGDGQWKTGAISDSKYIISATWNDVPHLSEKAKADLLEAIPKYARRVRSTGEPFMEAGLVYPVDLDQIIIPVMQIPEHFHYLNGLDVGFRNTAALFGRYDKDNDIIYIIGEQLFQEKTTAEYGPLLDSMHKDEPWIVDSAANMRSQGEGVSIRAKLEEFGMTCFNPAIGKAVEAGIYTVMDRMIQGKLKIFGTCYQFIKELKSYARDETGKVIKTNDHFCDAGRYLVTTIEEAQQKHSSKPKLNFATRKW